MFSRRGLFALTALLGLPTIKAAASNKEKPKILMGLYSVWIPNSPDKRFRWKLKVKPASHPMNFGNSNINAENLFGWDVQLLTKEEEANPKTMHFGSIYLTQRQINNLR